MHVSYSLGLSATSYYLFSTAIFVACLCFFSFGVLKSSSALLFFSAVLFSPATLILLHTPRYVLAMAFFLLAMFALHKRSYLLCVCSVTFSVLSHTVGGAVTGAFIVMYSMTPLFQGLSVIALSMLFYAAIVGYFDFIAPFSAYAAEDHDRGFGRLLVAIFTFLFAFLLFKGRSNMRFFLFFLFCLTVFFFYLTPYTHRLLYFLLFFSIFYLMFNSKTLFSRGLVVLYFSLNFLFSIYIVKEGLYGY